VTADSYSIWPRERASILFLGRGDDILARVNVAGDTAATYELKGNESYVRARVEMGRTTAWTPAVFVRP
jgi:hypothetical protein